ncbi:hypothetical protein CBL_13771 [Carabus blaptoides fortunei]
MLFIAIKVLVTKEASQKKSFVPAVGPGLGAVSQQHRSASISLTLSRFTTNVKEIRKAFSSLLRVRFSCQSPRPVRYSAAFVARSLASWLVHSLTVEQTVKKLDGHFTGSQCLATVGERHCTDNTCLLLVQAELGSRIPATLSSSINVVRCRLALGPHRQSTNAPHLRGIRILTLVLFAVCPSAIACLCSLARSRGRSAQVTSC